MTFTCLTPKSELASHALIYFFISKVPNKALDVVGGHLGIYCMNKKIHGNATAAVHFESHKYLMHVYPLPAICNRKEKLCESSKSNLFLKPGGVGTRL